MLYQLTLLQYTQVVLRNKVLSQICENNIVTPVTLHLVQMATYSHVSRWADNNINSIVTPGADNIANSIMTGMSQVTAYRVYYMQAHISPGSCHTARSIAAQS